MDSNESLKHRVANGQDNSNLTTQSSIFNVILKTRVFEPLLINYYDSIKWCLGQITVVYSQYFSQCIRSNNPLLDGKLLAMPIVGEVTPSIYHLTESLH